MLELPFCCFGLVTIEYVKSGLFCRYVYKTLVVRGEREGGERGGKEKCSIGRYTFLGSRNSILIVVNALGP